MIKISLKNINYIYRKLVFYKNLILNFFKFQIQKQTNDWQQIFLHMPNT